MLVDLTVTLKIVLCGILQLLAIRKAEVGDVRTQNDVDASVKVRNKELTSDFLLDCCSVSLSSFSQFSFAFLFSHSLN